MRFRACRKVRSREEAESRKEVGTGETLRTLSAWVDSTRAGMWPNGREGGETRRRESERVAESLSEERGERRGGKWSRRRPEIEERVVREAWAGAASEGTKWMG